MQYLNDAQILTLICLNAVGVKGVGPRRILTIDEYIKRHQIDVQTNEIFSQVLKRMSDKAIHSVTEEDIEKASSLADSLMDKSSLEGIRYMGYNNILFPECLRHALDEEGKEKPSLFLWYKGDLSVLSKPSLAIIGTRFPTREGRVGGEYLASEFAKRGFNIVSGLALGCDTIGHNGALKVGGMTTAILGNGLDDDSIYPPENRELANNIVDNGGLLLSESPIGTRANNYTLVARDRLQAGLAMATVVIQTDLNGGTMHAANATLASNKPLYAMKYKNDAINRHKMCRGNVYLVEQQRAKYIFGGDDIDVISEQIKSSAVKNVMINLFDCRL